MVTFLSPHELSAFHAEHQFPFFVLGDPERRVYRRYGLTPGRLAAVFSAPVRTYYWRAFREGRAIHLPRSTTEVFQLGGDFLVDEQGVIRMAYYSERPGDRPSVEDILRAIP